MQCLIKHEYFKEKVTDNEFESYYFRKPEYEISIENKRFIVWWNSPFDFLEDNPRWFQVLYAKTYLTCFEKRNKKFFERIFKEIKEKYAKFSE